MRHFFRILENVIVQPTTASIMARPELWDANPVRTTIPNGPHSQVSDILLRFGAADLSTLQTEDQPAMAKIHEAKKIALDVMRMVQGDQLGRVMITRLPAGGRITPHADEGPYARFYNRYHLVLQGLPGSLFRCDDETVQMLTGELWWFNSHLEHEVMNNSKDDRIHMIIDCRVP